MACPRCGADCQCSPPVSTREAHTTVFIDPDHYDPSEEQFAASFDAPSPSLGGAASSTEFAYGAIGSTANVAVAAALQEDVFYRPQPSPSLVDDAWRSEVSSRLNNFRARRRRPAHIKQSMSFQFDAMASPAAATAAQAAPAPEMAPAQGGYVAIEYGMEERTAALVSAEEFVLTGVQHTQAAKELPVIAPAPPPVRRKKLIEFPRAVEPVEEPTLFDALAEPVIQTPRILEAEPEPEPVPEASFAGMTLDSPVQDAAVDDPPLVIPEVAIPTAPLTLRWVADAIDGMMTLMGTVVFLAVARSIAHPALDNRTLMASSIVSYGFFWAAYQCILWIWAGTTVGTIFCGMELRSFDGVTPSVRRRVARACSAVLSLSAAGMGYIWSAVDEDGLGWHDRISRTCCILRERD